MAFEANVTPGTPTVTNVQTGSTPSMSPAMKTYYDTELLENARETLVLDQFAVKEKIKGRKVEFRRFETFDYMPKDVVLQEGVIPRGTPFGQTVVETETTQVGAYTAISDRLEMEAVDNTILACTEEHGARSGEIIEKMTRNSISGGTFAACAPKISDGKEVFVDDPSDMDRTSVLTPKIVAKMATWLKKNKVPKIDGSWISYLHPSNSYDLRQTKAWQDAHKYTDAKAIFRGEIGELDSIRFCESNEVRVHAPCVICDEMQVLTVSEAVNSGTAIKIEEELTATTPDTPIPVYVGGVPTTVTKIETSGGTTTLTVSDAVTAVKGDKVVGQGGTKDGACYYDVLFFGANAYGMADPEGGALEMLIKPKEVAGGPLEQFSTVGWKATTGSLILYPERVIRLECSSELADDVEN